MLMNHQKFMSLSTIGAEIGAERGLISKGKIYTLLFIVTWEKP